MQLMINFERRAFCTSIRTLLLNDNIDIGLELDTILSSESLMARACKGFIGQKSLESYVTKKQSYIAPVDIPVGFDEMSLKNDVVHYIPVLKTLGVILGHEDVIGAVLNTQTVNDNRLHDYRDGTNFKSNELFSGNKNALQIVCYHDDFNLINPLVQKHKISAFYFLLGNLPVKYRSRLSNIHLLLLCPSKLIKKYGYASILQPALDDLLKLESVGCGMTHIFHVTVSMLVADNLAAHAIGGYFSNFSTVARFCRFCMALRTSLNDVRGGAEPRTKEMYDHHIQSIDVDSSLSSTYGIKYNSCLNCLNYSHVADGLPPDFAHDILEGFAKDLTLNLILHLIHENYSDLVS